MQRIPDRLRVLAVLVTAALVAAACVSPAAPTPTPAGSPTGATPTAGASPTPAAEAVELTLLEHQDPRINELRELLPQFEAEMACLLYTSPSPRD